MRGPSSPKAESLRRVMLALRVRLQFSHPEFRVPYALVGDGGR
jgi:CHAT domain-containing protein